MCHWKLSVCLPTSLITTELGMNVLLLQIFCHLVLKPSASATSTQRNSKFGEIGFGDVDWIHLPRDRDRWRALVNTVMNLRVP
jgi:hypothetical protein